VSVFSSALLLVAKGHPTHRSRKINVKLVGEPKSKDFAVDTLVVHLGLLAGSIVRQHGQVCSPSFSSFSSFSIPYLSGRLHHASRNPELIKGIGKYSRSVMYRRSGRAQKKKSGVAWKVAAKKATEAAQPKVKPFRKETRTIQPKGPHYYPEYGSFSTMCEG